MHTFPSQRKGRFGLRTPDSFRILGIPNSGFRLCLFPNPIAIKLPAVAADMAATRNLRGRLTHAPS